MSKLIVVSNRLPVTVVKRRGEFQLLSSVGGLATGLASLDKYYKRLWVGWPGITMGRLKDKRKEIEENLRAKNLYPVFLSGNDIEGYYQGFCNETVWPLFHYFLEFVEYNREFWDAYKRVNKAFCDALIEVASPDDMIWIHDYHLMLLPQLARERLPKAKIGFFLHIPFPSSEVFRLIPWCEDVIKGLLGSDLIGFHTYDYVRHFLESVRRLQGYEHTLGEIAMGSRVLKVDAFPMGIDYEKFSGANNDANVIKKIARYKQRTGKHKVILSIDRLDYTKGVPQRLEAFNTFLNRNPEYKEKIIFIVVAAPSRIQVERYRQLKQKVDNLIGQINGRHGTIGWVPIWYLFRSFQFNDLAALYSIADVALVTPLRDGMNLIAKEFVATKGDGRGVLILSEMAGAAKELGEALMVNPNDEEGIYGALKKALDMPEEEQVKRMLSMHERLRRYDVKRWAKDIVDGLNKIAEIQKEKYARELSSDAEYKLLRDYARSKNRLLLLDYDGTLMPFSQRPEEVSPDEELMNILKSLSKESANKVIIISGRKKEELEKWLGALPLYFVAEHGVWIKEKYWRTIEPLSDDWKKEIRPILDFYVDRTPGSLVEEKDFSLVWHYRNVDAALAMVRAGELKDILMHITANLNVGVLEGNKIIEIKSTGINKGRAALHWISSEKWDFVLSIGDDRTDEDVFGVLPADAYSIKVGFGPSKAKYNLPSFIEVRRLLREIAGL